MPLPLAPRVPCVTARSTAALPTTAPASRAATESRARHSKSKARARKRGAGGLGQAARNRSARPAARRPVRFPSVCGTVRRARAPTCRATWPQIAASVLHRGARRIAGCVRCLRASSCRQGSARAGMNARCGLGSVGIAHARNLRRPNASRRDVGFGSRERRPPVPVRRKTAPSGQTLSIVSPTTAATGTLTRPAASCYRAACTPQCRSAPRRDARPRSSGAFSLLAAATLPLMRRPARR